MIGKKIVLCSILLCFILLSGCARLKMLPKFEIEKQENEQYILTSSDGDTYISYKNDTWLWYPRDIIIGKHSKEAIGKCDLGYVFETSSEVCLYTDDMRGSMAHYFFPLDIDFPELSLESTGNSFLEPADGNEPQKIINEELKGKLIECYNNKEMYESKYTYSMEIVWMLYIECEEFKDLYFTKPIYKDGTNYYMYTIHEDNIESGETEFFYCNCTSIIKQILDNHD